MVKNIPEPIPSFTPAPTLLPTTIPSPSVQQPFLELPWDYESKSLSFTEAALSMTSFFDHTYPLLSIGLSEPDDMKSQVTTFGNDRSVTKNYSSHDGYDYSKKAGAHIGDPVLAAAAGTATFINTCAKCGNMIVIDHGNRYQTRYMHLQKEGLLISEPTIPYQVSSKQQIGKIGATGNVTPPGKNGAHIHFSVLHDKDNNGKFEDNIPDGFTDPFGWQSMEPDPWEEYVFSYLGTTKKGSKSLYLWNNPLDSFNQTITQTGGNIAAGKYNLTFPQDSVTDPIKVTVSFAPILNLTDKSSLGPIMIALAKDPIGKIVTLFQRYIAISIDFSAYDLSSYKPESLAIYSSTDGKNWTKEETILDLINKKATTNVNHFTQFALFGERSDTVSPITTFETMGIEGESSWFRSDVAIHLTGEDNINGTGVDYTIYKIDDQDWELYTTPVTTSEEGNHKIEFYSVDNDENMEPIKKYEFTIDTVAPEAIVNFDEQLSKLNISPDDLDSVLIYQPVSTIKDKDLVIKDRSGNVLSFKIKSIEEKNLSKLVISDLAYNKVLSSKFTEAGIKIHHINDKQTINKKLVQTLQIDDTLKVDLDYKAKLSTTNVTIYENNMLTSQQVVAGVRILLIKTLKGDLSFSY